MSGDVKKVSNKTLPVTQVAVTDLSDMLAPKGGRRMALPGFDDEFIDFPDYIIRITDRIWHERKVDMIYDYYAKDCIVHTQLGTGTGVQPVVDGTHATMTAFPDRVLDADNVVWSEDAPQAGSDNPVFYSSHLITSKMTNLGPSEFGRATGRKTRVITIADCACRDNVIFEEWLVRDYAAIVTHLGFDVAQTAAQLAKDDVASGKDIVKNHADNYMRVQAGKTLPTTKVEHPEQDIKGFVESYFGAIWQNQNYHQLPEFYDFRVAARYAGDRNLYGHDQIQPVIAALLSGLSNIKISIDHISDIPYLGEARDIAVRWSLSGEHLQDGAYGPATGAKLYILAISQFRLINGRIREEVTIWDDVALRRMIEGARLRQDSPNG